MPVLSIFTTIMMIMYAKNRQHDYSTIHTVGGHSR